jgi:N-acetylglucosamine kinase-like BadF-type ATPase
MGLDVGGSVTKVVVVDNGRVVEQAQAAAGNLLLTPDITDRLCSLILAAAPDRAGAGLPGLSDAGTADAIAHELSARCGVPVRVAVDMTVAWLGAFLGRPGIVVAAGTGSFAVGGPDLGSLRRAGGNGFLVGDEGSAYWLGREAVRAALADVDGIGPPTTLGGLIEGQTGLDLAALVRRIHRAPGERSVLAGLAPLVTAAAGAGPVAPGSADQGDAVAWAIVESAADALADLARAIQRQFGPLPVAGVGGVLTGPVRAHLARRVVLQEPAAEPAVGAALLAATAGPAFPLVRMARRGP